MSIVGNNEFKNRALDNMTKSLIDIKYRYLIYFINNILHTKDKIYQNTKILMQFSLTTLSTRQPNHPTGYFRAIKELLVR